MLTCKGFTEFCSDYLDGNLPWAGRVRVLWHLATCSACRAYLRQMRQTVKMLGVQRSEAVDPVVEAALLERFRAAHGGGATRGSASLGDRVLAAFEGRLGGVPGSLTTGMALVTSFVLVLLVHPLPGMSVPLAAGATCMATELAAAAVPLAAMAVLMRVRRRTVRWQPAKGSHALPRWAPDHPGASESRPRPTRLGGSGLAAVAAAGAVVGQAMLHFSCPEGGMRLHLFLFHFGGVVVAAALGALTPRLLAAR